MDEDDLSVEQSIQVEQCAVAKVRFLRRNYRAFWHARWGCFFDFMETATQYQPGHIGITGYMGINPTFLIKSGPLLGTYVHVVPNHPPSDAARVAGLLVASARKERFVFLCSPPYRPRRDYIPMSPPAWTCEPDGKYVMQFWSGRRGSIELSRGENQKIFHSDVLNALLIASEVRLK